MIRPAYLKKGDKIAIVSPARSITFEEVHPAIKFFQRNDLEVVLGSYVFSRNHQFAGTDIQRCRDFQHMLDDDQIRAIICSRGGYGTVRIIDNLDFTAFRERPKWIVGYSDVTVLHSHIHRQFGIETIHATMPVNIKEGGHGEPAETMVNALFGNGLVYTFPKSGPSREGVADGLLVGGNLSILCSLMGSGSEMDTAGKILFLEDVDEYLYHIDRMMMNLRRAGKLEKLKGLVVGGMTRMNDNSIAFGKSACEIVADAVKDYKFPVCYDFPAGHQDNNLALLLGREVHFMVGREVELSFY
ncbi:MAG: S66 peptidase family protein [Bacteroidales bacterium]